MRNEIRLLVRARIKYDCIAGFYTRPTYFYFSCSPFRFTQDWRGGRGMNGLGLEQKKKDEDCRYQSPSSPFQKITSM